MLLEGPIIHHLVNVNKVWWCYSHRQCDTVEPCDPDSLSCSGHTTDHRSACLKVFHTESGVPVFNSNDLLYTHRLTDIVSDPVTQFVTDTWPVKYYYISTMLCGCALVVHRCGNGDITVVSHWRGDEQLGRENGFTAYRNTAVVETVLWVIPWVQYVCLSVCPDDNLTQKLTTDW